MFGVERDPIDNVLLARHAALGLPALIQPRRTTGQIVGNFRRAGDPIHHAAADRVKPFVELERHLEWRGSGTARERS